MCSVFDLNDNNVNALIARELSGFPCARSQTMNWKFSIPHSVMPCGVFKLLVHPNIEAILEVMNAIELLVKIRPEKNSGQVSVSQRSWVQISYGPEFFPALIFTTSSVVFITAKIASILVSSTAVHIYDFHIFTVIYSRSLLVNLCR